MKNRTPFHYAAWKNSKDVLEILFSRGADINAKDINVQMIQIII